MITFKWNRIFVTLVCLTLMLALAIGNVSASPTWQGETDFAAFDAYVTEQMDKLGIPGMALGIVQGDQIVHQQGFGVADSSGRTVTPQTPFYIGSVSKSFTALAVMQLVEEGKIDLDASIQTYLPWFELADKEASAQITVRNLLNHTTGISQRDGNRYAGSVQGLEETVRGLNIIQPTQPVGTSFQYSNINYMVAGLIVEQVSGQSYADYVTKHILEPLDMRHSYGSPAPALADGLAEGHIYMFGHAFAGQCPPPVALVPAGGLIASVEDLSHYAIAQLNNGRYNDTSILAPQGIGELHTSAILMGGNDYYAKGWIVGKMDGLPAVWHGGTDTSNLAMLILMPERGKGVILLSNAGGFVQASQVDQMSRGVVSLLNGKTPAPISLPSATIFLYWMVLLTPVMMILGIVYSWRHWRNKGVGYIILTLVLYGGFALFCLVGVPLMTAPIWATLRFFSPDFAYALIAAAILGIGWSVVYTAMSLNARRVKQGFQ